MQSGIERGFHRIGLVFSGTLLAIALFICLLTIPYAYGPAEVLSEDPPTREQSGRQKPSRSEWIYTWHRLNSPSKICEKAGFIILTGSADAAYVNAASANAQPYLRRSLNTLAIIGISDNGKSDAQAVDLVFRQ